MLDLDYFELTDVGVVRDHGGDYLGHYLPATPDEGHARGAGSLWLRTAWADTITEKWHRRLRWNRSLPGFRALRAEKR